MPTLEQYQVRKLTEQLDASVAERDQLRAELAAANARAEAAESALAAVDEYATYYACAWEAFEADSDGPEPLDFAEWLTAGKPEVQP